MRRAGAPLVLISVSSNMMKSDLTNTQVFLGRTKVLVVIK